MARVLITVAMLALAANAAAERLSLGTMDQRPCRAKLYLEITAPHFQRVQDELRACAERGVKAATLSGLVNDRAAAAPRFWEEFQTCSRYVEWVDADLAVETSCR